MHATGGVHGDRVALVALVAVTLLAMYLVTLLTDRTARERPLVRQG